MTRWVLRSGAPAATIVLGVMLTTGTASAAPADATAYGQHVRECAQSMGFDGAHNPGMHRGASMWDPGHVR
jgi:hypothetical protein